MRKQYKKLTYSDRQVIADMVNGKKATPKELAVTTGVHIATIYRELERGGKPYDADRAQRALFG